MDNKKLINYSEISLKLTGNKNTIRSNRENVKYVGELQELLNFLDGWVFRNSKLNKAEVTIKTK
jgi:hypothetical protein